MSEHLELRDAGAALATLLEKAAMDNGFDLDGGAEGLWRKFSSTHAPLTVWLAAAATPAVAVALSRPDVAQALDQFGTRASGLPEGAAAAVVVSDIPAVHVVLRRAFQLAKSLPNQLLHVFEKKTAGFPRTTEAERLVVQRVGQNIFRQGLLDYWDERCPVTGLAVPELLKASHIKPWAACETDIERLDVFNGLLLAPNLDAAFDRGLLTFSDAGEIVPSARLAVADRVALGLSGANGRIGLTAQHRAYLAWHRSRVFKE